MKKIDFTAAVDLNVNNLDPINVIEKLNRFLQRVKLDSKFYTNNEFIFHLKAGILDGSRLGVEIVAPKHLSERSDKIHWDNYRIIVELNNEPVTEAYFSEFNNDGNDNPNTRLIARAIFPETVELEPGLNYTLKIVPGIDSTTLTPLKNDTNGNSGPGSRRRSIAELHKPALL